MIVRCAEIEMSVQNIRLLEYQNDMKYYKQLNLIRQFMNQTYKQNYPLNKVITPRSARKFSYATAPEQNNIPTVRQIYSVSHKNPQQYIHHLEQELLRQKQKCKRIEQHTIKQQTKVLEQISLLQSKFIEVEREKAEMKVLLDQSINEIQEYKKVKGVAEAMINMMEKVEGRSGNYHDAWRWIKKVVWEYETIRKKGLQWKKAYDKMKRMEKQDTFNNNSDDSCISSDNQ